MLVLPGRVVTELTVTRLVLAGNVVVTPDCVTVEAGTVLVLMDTTVEVVGGNVTVDTSKT